MAIAQRSVSGTITGTGATTAIKARKIDVSLDFGTGTVAVQRSLDGTNYKDVEEFTADAEKTYDGAVPAYFRLNCSAYTADISYTYRADGEF